MFSLRRLNLLDRGVVQHKIETYNSYLLCCLVMRARKTTIPIVNVRSYVWTMSHASAGQLGKKESMLDM